MPDVPDAKVREVFRFVVEVEADPGEEELTGGGLAPVSDVLQSEIKSNLESLRGIEHVRVVTID